MPSAIKTYRSCFVLEKTKLTRLLTIIRERMAEYSDPQEETFDIQLTGFKHLHCDSVEQVLELDNSKRSRIERLVISRHIKAEAEGMKKHDVTVDFDGHHPVDVTIGVESENGKWVTETMSLVEEQVERALERGLIHRMFNTREPTLLLASALLLLGLLIAFITVPSLTPGGVARTMWLTSADLREFNDANHSEDWTKTDPVKWVVERQLRNLIAQQNKSLSDQLKDWRVIMLIIPIILLIGALIYLTQLYPRAVFLWGDAEDWYESVTKRRSFVWNILVATLVLGLIANLAVYALGSLVGPVR